MPFGTFIQDFIICGSPDIHLLGDFCGAQTFDAQRQNAAAVYSGLAAESNAFCPSLQSPSSFVRSSIRSRSALATVDSMLTTIFPIVPSVLIPSSRNRIATPFSSNFLTN